MEEGRLHGEHIQMRRTIETKLGAASVKITDEFSNQGELDQALMFFYHINIGHPVLGEGARFAAPSKRVWAESAHAKADIATYDRCTLPQKGYIEQQFFHEMGADADGNTIVALINDALELAVWLKYNVRELPCIAEWKVLRDAIRSGAISSASWGTRFSGRWSREARIWKSESATARTKLPRWSAKSPQGGKAKWANRS